ncbi:hypothetical protein GDO86_004858 [Hymenochirus boettgeri]|uniref:G-protein coupled receptors family 1 profile domain-containing protein n=1 Tax=Hymenochirus boettgeri TaxID=247094 RepID=A0A8T2KFN3_9PIPI|nr:hypothetical protein GDO86_004858 [Hymenochirus boettgeri]
MESLYPNQSLFLSYTEFVLLGFPGISWARHLLGITFLTLYAVILTCNGLIIYLIFFEKTLHSPMYYLIALLFAINIAGTSVVMPKAIVDLFYLNPISLSVCLIQMFFIYFLTNLESNILLLMSLDRYVAICRPLRYHNIMTKSLLACMIIIVFILSFVSVSPVVIFTSMVPFCRSNIILDFACENMALLSLACGDISKPQTGGLIGRTITTCLNVGVLLISYSNILYTAMKTVSGKSRHKALNTVATHLIVAMLAYLCAMASSILSRTESSFSVDVKNLFSAIYLIIPATLNPFIYGLRVTEIRGSLAKHWRKMYTSNSH